MTTVSPADLLAVHHNSIAVTPRPHESGRLVACTKIQFSSYTMEPSYVLHCVRMQQCAVKTQTNQIPYHLMQIRIMA